jgi:hypothetical protein
MFIRRTLVKRKIRKILGSSTRKMKASVYGRHITAQLLCYRNSVFQEFHYMNINPTVTIFNRRIKYKKLPLKCSPFPDTPHLLSSTTPLSGTQREQYY